MFSSIVVGTDGSETAREAVSQAVELAKRLDASPHVVSAYAPGSRQGDPEQTTRPAAPGRRWLHTMRGNPGRGTKKVQGG